MAKKITDENLNVNISVNGGNEAKKKLGDLEKANRDLKTQQEDLRKAKQQLVAEGKKESAAYKQIEADLKKTKQQLDENSAAQKETRKEIGLTGLTMSQLVKEQRRITSQIKTGTTKGTEDYNRLKKELQEVNKVINEQRDDLRDTGEAMGGVGEMAETMGGALNDIFSGLQSGNFQQVGAGFATIKQGIVAATRAGLAFIATPIGAAIAALATVGIAAKAWFDYNSAAVEALKITRQITGLSDQAADNARIRAKVLSDTFGGELKENLEVARGLVTQFGISYDEAFDVIEGKLVRGQRNNDEFFDSLKEYPTFFADAEFSAQEFANVIAAGYDLSIYSDKLPDALKEANISLREQTPATREAMLNAFGSVFTDDILGRIDRGETSIKDALKEISAEADKQGLSIQQNAQLTADLFRGAGEDAGGAIKVFQALNVALNEQQKPLTESDQLLQDQIETTKELEQVQSALFGTGEKGFGLLIDRAKLFGTKTLVTILKAGVDVVNWIVDLNNKSGVFSGILATIGVVSTASFEILSTLVNNAKEQFGGLGDIIEGVFTLDTDKIKLGMLRTAAATGKAYEELKIKAKAAGDSISAAFSGENKMQRVSIETFVSGEMQSTTNNGGGNSGTNGKSSDAAASKAWKETETQLHDFIEAKRKERELNQKAGLVKELALIDEKYSQEIEKAKGHSERLKEIEALRDQEKNDLRLLRQKEYLDQAAAIDEENRILREEAELEREVAAAETQIQKDELRLQHAREMALQELDIMREAELAKVEAIEGSEKLIFSIKEKYRLQAEKLNLEFDKQEQNLKKDQVTWTEMTEQQKANAVTGSLSIIAGAFNEGSEAWKAAKIAETIIATTQAAQNAYTFMAAIGGPVLGAIGAAAATAAGLKNVQKISQTELQKMPKPGNKKVRGHEDGIYPVTRTDGKKYNAAYGGDAGTRLVHRPTVFSNNGGYLAGEGDKTEMIIDNAVFRRMDPAVVDHIMSVRQRVRGYESGMYPDVPGAAASTAQPAPVDPELKTILSLVAARLSEPIKTYTVYGYDDEENRQKIQDEIANSKQNGNLTP